MPFDATDYQPQPRLLDCDPKGLTKPKERLAYLRDFLRELPPGRFNMTTFAAAPDEPDFISAERVRNDCGTTACIAGWCNALFTDAYDVDGSWGAARILALSEAQSSTLFYANASHDADAVTYWDATPAQAANVLDHLLLTGEVDWSKA